MNTKEMERPQQLTEINLNALKKVCEQYLDELQNGNEDEDTQHYIFEAALEAIYGKEVWKFVNSRL